MRSTTDAMIAGAMAAVWLSALIAAAFLRPGWMDEFTTASWTDPHQPLSSAWAVWLGDVHPPWYYALLRFWRTLAPGGGDPLLFMRALGLLVSAMLALAALRAWSVIVRRPLWPFALLLFSSPLALYAPQEARSYFLSLFGGVFLSLYVIACIERDGDAGGKVWPPRAALLAGMLGALLCSVHLISLGFCGFALGAVALVQAHRRDWRGAAATATIAILALGPTCLFVILVTARSLLGAAGDYWITRREVGYAILILPLFLGLPVLASIAGGAAARARPRGAWTMTAIAAAFFALCCVTAIVKPFFVTRYFTAAIAALLAPAALLLGDLAGRIVLPSAARVRLPLAMAGVALCFAAGVICAAAMTARARGEWREPAEAVAGAPACRGATIPYLVLGFAPARVGEWEYMFEWYAPQSRYLPATAQTRAAADRQACPVRLWVAHSPRRRMGADAMAAAAAACAGGQRDALVFNQGYLIVDRAAADMHRAWRGPIKSCGAIAAARAPLL